MFLIVATLPPAEFKLLLFRFTSTPGVEEINVFPLSLLEFVALMNTQEIFIIHPLEIKVFRRRLSNIESTSSQCCSRNSKNTCINLLMKCFQKNIL